MPFQYQRCMQQDRILFSGYLEITRDIAVYAKWSQSIWSNVDELGSGNDRIDGNTRSLFTGK